MMLIDELREEYLDGVVEIEKECFEHPWTYDNLKEEIGNDISHFLVAIIDNKVVGYLGLQIINNEGYITNVGVLKEYRHKGIAQELIKKSFENKMDFISLEVRESNSPAINLYAKIGFKNQGIRPNFYRDPKENAIIMTKFFNN